MVRVLGPVGWLARPEAVADGGTRTKRPKPSLFRGGGGAVVRVLALGGHAWPEAVAGGPLFSLFLVRRFDSLPLAHDAPPDLPSWARVSLQAPIRHAASVSTSSSAVRNEIEDRVLVVPAGEACVLSPVSGLHAPYPAALDLFDLPEADACWSVLHTFSNREKRAAVACEGYGARHFLPLRRKRVRGKSGPGVAVPLFPGYLFACLSWEARRTLLQSKTVARVIAVPRPEGLLEELRQIHAAMAAGADLVPAPSFERGRWVHVVAGPFEGVLGQVGDRRVRRGVVRLILNVSMLGRSATVEINPDDVELLPASRVPNGAAIARCAGAPSRRSGDRVGHRPTASS